LRVVHSPRAGEDILGYYTYIGLRDELAAERFLDAVDHTFARLAQQPEIGSTRLWRHQALHGVRAWPVVGFRQFIVYYERRSETTLWIIRILRASVPPDDVLRTPVTD
jgi:Plasmid stabilisation system protein.